jgi:8-oxo-dGTP diphosphatase
MRRFGKAPDPQQSYRPRPGAYGILLRCDQILLTHQARPVPEFQLPGGGIDPGESPLRALHREVFEETGWSISRARRLGAFRRFVYMPEYDLWAEKICLIYIGFPTRRIGPPSEPDHQAVWRGIADATRLVGNPGDRHFLKSLVMRGL